MKYLATIALAVALVLVPVSMLQAFVEEPADYRQGAYRADVPATLKGAKVISTSQAHALWQKGETIFIDVLPAPPRPQGLSEDAVWREPKRANIPESTWLANVGFGRLHESVAEYYRSNLETLTGGDKQKPLVIYCQAKCWMSWNAAKRALELGYRDVTWYPDGTTGWAAADLPMQRNSPLR